MPDPEGSIQICSAGQGVRQICETEISSSTLSAFMDALKLIRPTKIESSQKVHQMGSSGRGSGRACWTAKAA